MISEEEVVVPVQVSLEYYVQRVQQTDMMAAQLMQERNQLRERVEALTKQIEEIGARETALVGENMRLRSEGTTIA